MTLIEFIEKAKNAIEHGQDPNVPLCAWDPDIEEWSPVTAFTLSSEHVLIYTDDNGP